MQRSRMHADLSHLSRVVVDEEALSRRLDELAAEITVEYAGRRLVVVVILTGGLMFAADLLRRIPLPLRLECLSASSYQGETRSSGAVYFRDREWPDVAGSDVLVLDDILDTGLTLSRVCAELRGRGARTLQSCVLLAKRRDREAVIEADHTGFTIEDEFVVGYGLDYRQQYRNLPVIGVLAAEHVC